MKNSVLLMKFGGTLWITLAGGTIILLLLHALGVINAQEFDWRLFATLFGVGGLTLFVIAGILSVWENHS